MVWLVACVVGVGWFWGAILRYVLHLLACGHVAVLTELITRGRIGNGSEARQRPRRLCRHLSQPE